MPQLSLSGYIAIGLLVALPSALAIQSQLSGAAQRAPARSNSETPGTSKPTQQHPITIRVPLPPPDVETGQRDRLGAPIALKCRNCHDIRPANAKNSASEHMDEFHQGLSFDHGKMTCVACHNSLDGYTTLHLADNTALEYADTMKLCAQCHGTQHRDYQHGSHGGMTGYWDLTKGPRQRNHCIDCHDPHSPQFPPMIPASGPNDRFSPHHQDSVH